MNVSLHSEVHALRPTRVDQKRNEFVHYEAITFPRNPWAGIEMYLRRARIAGSIDAVGSDYGIDILNIEGDIVQEFDVEKSAFDYLKRAFKCKVERD